MKQAKNYKHTIYACYMGYITQAIVNNLAPLLFLTFQREFAIDLRQITLLVTVNFAVQLCVDLLAARYADKIGYRKAIVAAHIFSALGLVGLGVFPDIFPTPYSGLIAAVFTYAIGGGIIEVLVSPIVETCPSKNKSSAMSLLHSFFCWGCVAVISISTLLFVIIGIENWKYVACFWALIPAANAVYFSRVPIAEINPEGDSMTMRELLKSRLFWVLLLLMVCSGASELAMSQWASAFAESALGISKTMGDLAGPCFFAVSMGIARVLHSKLASRLSLEKYMVFCAFLCILSYAASALSSSPLIGLLGCGTCGFSVGVMWPGSFSLAAGRCPKGGTALFALLALGGDLGCGLGPTLVGIASGAFNDNLKTGLAFAIIFPILLMVGIGLLPGKNSN